MSEQRAYDVRSFVKAYGISRSQVYLEIKSGRLAIFKVGRRTLISRHAAETWCRKLEEERARSTHALGYHSRQANASGVGPPEGKSRVAEAKANGRIMPPVK